MEQSPLPSSIEITPRSRTQRRNERGETPLHVACIKGDLKTATSLVQQGAEVNAVDNAGKVDSNLVLYSFLGLPFLLLLFVVVVCLLVVCNTPFYYCVIGWTPLHEACNHGHSVIVGMLLQHGAKVNVRGMEGDTPMHDAVINGHLEVRSTTW